MKRYLLLTTAAMFLATSNAWATDSTGQSITMNFTGTIAQAATITKGYDANFGTIVARVGATGGTGGKFVAGFDGPEGYFDCGEGAVACLGTRQVGDFTITSSNYSIIFGGLTQGESGGVLTLTHVAKIDGNDSHFDVVHGLDCSGNAYIDRAYIAIRDGATLTASDFGALTDSVVVSLAYE